MSTGPGQDPAGTRTVAPSSAERTAAYGIRRAFAAVEEPGEAAGDPLDAVSDPDATFGSYAALAADERHRYRVRPVTRRTTG